MSHKKLHCIKNKTKLEGVVQRNNERMEEVSTMSRVKHFSREGSLFTTAACAVTSQPQGQNDKSLFALIFSHSLLIPVNFSPFLY